MLQSFAAEPGAIGSGSRQEAAAAQAPSESTHLLFSTPRPGAAAGSGSDDDNHSFVSQASLAVLQAPAFEQGISFLDVSCGCKLVSRRTARRLFARSTLCRTRGAPTPTPARPRLLRSTRCMNTYLSCACAPRRCSAIHTAVKVGTLSGWLIVGTGAARRLWACQRIGRSLQGPHGALSGGRVPLRKRVCGAVRLRDRVGRIDAGHRMQSESTAVADCCRRRRHRAHRRCLLCRAAAGRQSQQCCAVVVAVHTEYLCACNTGSVCVGNHRVSLVISNW